MKKMSREELHRWYITATRKTVGYHAIAVGKERLKAAKW